MGRAAPRFAAFIDRVPGELLHYYLEAGMLKGINARVEGARRGPTPSSGAQEDGVAYGA